LQYFLKTLKWATVLFLTIFFIGSIANSVIMISFGPYYGTRTEYQAHWHFIYRTYICLIITAIVTFIKITVDLVVKNKKVKGGDSL
jgi:hypothetical protein